MTKETEFVKHIRKHLEEYGFSLVFGKGRRVNVGGARCEGYFNYGKTKKERRIVVARKSQTWLYVLAHEYCHFLQWLEYPTWYSSKFDISQDIVNNVSVGVINKAVFHNAGDGTAQFALDSAPQANNYVDKVILLASAIVYCKLVGWESFEIST